MTCNWYINGKRCRKNATKRAHISANPKRGEPVLFPICDHCSKTAPQHWAAKKITGVIK